MFKFQITGSANCTDYDITVIAKTRKEALEIVKEIIGEEELRFMHITISKIKGRRDPSEIATEILNEVENALAEIGIVFNDQPSLYKLKEKYGGRGKW